MDTTFLIGNGINNAVEKFAWEDLLTKLIDFLGAKSIDPKDGKPFPLLYEEIMSYALKQTDYNELEVKSFISKNIPKHKNDIFIDYAASRATHILTTNYDHNIQLALKGGYAYSNKGIVNEAKYSIFRHDIVSNKYYWHIHGSIHSANSILLGYEHYCGYLQAMRSYVVSGTGTSYKNVKLKSLGKRFNSDDYSLLSWLDLFFTTNIHIIGLTLDYNEIHLWWLLSYRTRSAFRYFPRNTIKYYYPSSIESEIKSKLALLTSLDVKIIKIDAPNGDDIIYYQDVLQRAQGEFK